MDLAGFEKHFFAGKEPFYLTESKEWLEQILNLYQDSGLQIFQSIKVRASFERNTTKIISKVDMDDYVLEQTLNTAGCRTYDRVVRMIEGDQPHFEVCLYLEHENNFKISKL